MPLDIAGLFEHLHQVFELLHCLTLFIAQQIAQLLGVDLVEIAKAARILHLLFQFVPFKVQKYLLITQVTSLLLKRNSFFFKLFKFCGEQVRYLDSGSLLQGVCAQESLRI